MSKERRTEYEMIVDVVNACEEARQITSISRKSNMPTDRVRKFLDLLNRVGAIDKSYDSSRKKPGYVYATNHDGRTFNIIFSRIIENL